MSDCWPTAVPALVFFDIDGTLIGRQPEPPESARAAIRLLRQNGHLALINTGRPLSTIPPEITAIGFDGIVASCGAYVAYENRELLNVNIRPEILADVLPAMRRARLNVWLEGRDLLYVSDYEPNGEMARIVAWLGRGRDIIRSWHDPVIEANKISFQLRADSDYESCRPLLERHFQIIRHSPENGELLLPGLTKASGIRLLLHVLDLPHERTYAFGDSLNDLDMLQYVRHGIAMGNSRGSVRRISEHITADPDAQGILLGLRHFNLI